MNFKKIISFMLAITLCIPITAIKVSNSDSVAICSYADTTASDFEYSITQVGVVINGYNGTSTNVVIPNYIDGYPVTNIYPYVFANKPIESVEIPSSVTQIWSYAFKNCTNLHTVVITSPDTKIDEYAFYGCDNLNIEFTSEDDTITGTFETNEDATYSLNLNTGVLTISGTGKISPIYANNYTTAFTPIRDYAYDCNTNPPWKDYREYIKYVIVNEGITAIGNSMFANCSHLKSISIPSSVISISYNSFDRSKSLENIIVNESNPNFNDIDGVLFDKSLTTLIYYPLGKTANQYTIPNGVTTIGSGAFLLNYSLTNIDIPNSVTTIDEFAFIVSSNSNLKSITIPSSVNSIVCNNYGNVGYYQGYYGRGLSKIEDFIIYGEKGSKAEFYANNYDITFIEIDSENPISTDITEVTTEPIVTTTVPETTIEPVITTTPSQSNNATTMLSIFMVKKHLLGVSSISTSLGDFQKDGTINLLDLLILKKELLNN